MKLRQVKLAAWIVGGLLFAGLWIFFGPEKLGGSSTYSITSGISMQPLLHKNDLALVRAQPSYHVHDVVLYQSPTLHKPVLHRIILIQNGNYFFKGDNNNFVDPGYATRSELVGKLWLHVPAVGGILGWFSKPAHAAVLAGLVVMLLVLNSFTKTRQRKGHHRREPTQSKAASTPQPSFFEGPALTLFALGIFSLLAMLSLIIGFSRPLRRLDPLPGAYKQSGVFTYEAPVKTPTVVYPSGIVKTGDPIYPSLVNAVTVHFKYQFTSSFPHSIKGTIELGALLKSDTWQQLTMVQSATRFSGDSTDIATEPNLSDLYGLINSVSEQSGNSAVDYSADIIPVIHITGEVNGKPIDDRFEPALPFTIGRSIITLSDKTAPAAVGATYTLPSADTNQKLILNPSTTGSIPHLAANTVSIAKYQFKVSLIRLGGIIFVMLAAITTLLHNKLRRRQAARSDNDQIASKFQSLIIPVASLTVPEGATVIKVPDFLRLAELAQYFERPILSHKDGTGKMYAVDDGNNRYVTHSPRAALASASLAQAAVGKRPKQLLDISGLRHQARRAWSSIIARIIGGLVLLAVIATLATSLTASNTVPASRVGRSINARQILQLAPTGCNTLTLTSIVFKSGTATNTVSHALVIGSPGVDTILDTGNNNCIVAGGGKDAITGVSTDICIAGLTIGATYTTCVKK
jgi:signal peptidase I